MSVGIRRVSEGLGGAREKQSRQEPNARGPTAPAFVALGAVPRAFIAGSVVLAGITRIQLAHLVMPEVSLELVCGIFPTFTDGCWSFNAVSTAKTVLENTWKPPSDPP